MWPRGSSRRRANSLISKGIARCNNEAGHTRSWHCPFGQSQVFGTWHIKAAANSPAVAQRTMKTASEYAALWSHRFGVMVLTRASTASFAKKRLGIYSSEAAYSDWTRRAVRSTMLYSRKWWRGTNLEFGRDGGRAQGVGWHPVTIPGLEEDGH